MSRAKTCRGQGADSGYYAQFSPFSFFVLSKKENNTCNDLAASRFVF